jgi:hypothetical protein
MPLIPDDGAWSAWNYRMNNEIEWESFTDSGFDTIRFLAYYKPDPDKWREMNNPGATCFNHKLDDEDDDGVRDLVQANRYVFDRVKDLNVRNHFWPGDFNYVVCTDIGTYREPYPYHKYYCWPGECGGQGGTRPPEGEWDTLWCSNKPNIRDDIMDFYEDPDYPDYDIYNYVIKEYDDQPNVVWYEVINEPQAREFTCTSVLNEFLDIYSPLTPGLTNTVDRTGRLDEYIYPDVTNFYEWMICHTDLKIHLGRSYPFRAGNLPNSTAVYYGFTDKFGITNFGFYGLANHLERSREAAVKYGVPFWHYAQLADNTFLPDSDDYYDRLSTPRELRAEVNAAITYGASGFFYFNPYDFRYFKEENEEAVRQDRLHSVLDIDGNVKTGNYTTGSLSIPYQTLYNELVDINTKLHSVRDTLQTTVSLDAFRYDDIPRSLVCDYDGNRDRGDDDNYPPDRLPKPYPYGLAWEFPSE